MEQPAPHPAADPERETSGRETLPAHRAGAALPARDDGTPRSLEEYDWIPVLRKPRADGWTPDKQRAFIETLADCGSVALAARAVGMSEQSCYRLRRAPGSEEFCAAWSAAIDAASKRLIDEAFERALVGSDEPVFDREGHKVGRRFRKNDRMLMFLLRAYAPARFGSPPGASNATPVAEPPPVATALRALAPPVPEVPHLLMPPGQLEDALLCADILDGKAPQRLTGQAPQAGVAAMSLGDELERLLEDGKRENAGKPPLSDGEWKSLCRSREAHLS